MLLIERRRPCTPTAVALILVCLFMFVWHLSTVPNELLTQSPPAPQAAAAATAQLIQPIYEPVTKERATEIPFDVQSLPMWDYTTLINLDEFVFDLINFPCNDSENPPLLLILVHSAPINYEKRKIIRNTWGQLQRGVHVLFILGRVANSIVQNEVNHENNRHHDIIQGSFIDSYRNMTYKHVTALKYMIYHCPEARYILKTDDDIFVNMPMLLNFLTLDISPYGARRLIYCTPYFNSLVKRSYRSKWRVSPREYPGSFYPTYCPGWAIIYSPDVVFKLYDEAQRAEYFWIDDVHITGTLAKRANLTHTSFSLTLTDKQTEALVNARAPTNQSLNFLFASPDLSPRYIVKLWNIVQKYHTNMNINNSTVSSNSVT